MRIGKNILIVLLQAAFLSGCLVYSGNVSTVSPITETSSPIPTQSQTPISTKMPTVTPSPTPTVESCLFEEGEVIRTIFRTEVLKYPYEVSVYTPPCYGKGPEVLYPVLYLLHGQNMDDTFWLSLGIAELADKKISAGAPPFIIVMPREVKNFDPVTESGFGISIMTELIPWVESNYAVCTTRECRAIGGVSRGGGWAVRLAMRNFETFGAVGAHSMGLMPGDWWQAQNNLQTYEVDEFPRIYIDRGEDDFLAVDIDYFEKVLTRNAHPARIPCLSW